MVGNDGKSSLVKSRKERTLIGMKLDPRSCRWTQAARLSANKTGKTVKKQSDFVYITKVVRGFTLVPKALISAEEPKSEHKKKYEKQPVKKTEKVDLKSNLRK